MINKIKQFFQKGWKWLTALFVGGVVVAQVVGFPPPTGVVPQVFADNKTISFANTDNNVDEDLIIRSDALEYTQPTVYFSIENTSATDQNVDIVFTLKDSRTRIWGIKEFVSNTDLGLVASGSQQVHKIVSNWSEPIIGSPDLSKLTDSIKGNSNVKKKATVGSYQPGFKSFILAGQTKYYKAEIAAPHGVSILSSKFSPEPPLVDGWQEFFIEAYGDIGGYGNLDPKTITARGNAQVDTAQAKFGTGSLLLSTSAGDKIDTPDHADFAFGSGNFTLENWVRFASTTGTVGMIGQNGGAGQRAFIIYSGSGLNFFFTSNGTNITDVTRTFSRNINQWYHIAIVRNGADLMFFVDGAQIGATYDISTTSIFDSTSVFSIGDVSDIGEGPNAWYDEIRVSNVARWTANFTAPTSAYTCAATNTILLIHADGADASTTFTDDTTACPAAANDTPILIEE